MDSTVIEEIANQLGMAVDQAGQFITEHLPAYAGLKAMHAIVPTVMVWAVFLALAIVCVIAISVCAKAKERDTDAWLQSNGDYYSKPDWNNYLSMYVFFVVGFFAMLVLVIAIAVTANCLPDIIGWQSYPEAMLIDMAMKAVS